jgi:hypothetical protein
MHLLPLSSRAYGFSSPTHFWAGLEGWENGHGGLRKERGGLGLGCRTSRPLEQFCDSNIGLTLVV